MSIKRSNVEKIMKAIKYKKYGSANVVSITNILKPSPKANEVLVKVLASSVTRADTMMREGQPCFGRLFLGLTKHKNPMAGTGFAGEIEDIGEQVTHFKLGDAVFGETSLAFGANAEYLCLAEDAVMASLPNAMAYAEAAPICDGALTSFAFLKELANLKQGQSILIIGASGSLGTAAVQIAKNIGATVTAVCRASNHYLVKALGADYVIDYEQEEFINNHQQYDVIYDSVGKSTFHHCKQSLTSKGLYLSPVLSFSLLLNVVKTSIMGDKKAIFSAIGMKPASELNIYLNELKELFQMGSLYSVMDKTFNLEQASDAHRYVDAGHKKGNVVLINEF